MSNNRMPLLAGPCSMESRDICFQAAEVMVTIAEKYNLDYYYKTSFDKANRTSLSSWRGLGMEQGLEILAEVKREFGCKIVTDIHVPDQAAPTAEVADMLQIPAFLSRQTDLLVAAAKTGRAVNVKKAQFSAPWDMKHVVGKLGGAGCKEIFLCERGSSFGYNNLVVDMRSIPRMQSLGYPVIFDATHSVQKPSAGDGVSGGERNMVRTLALAASAAGADGFFFECHPNPDKALCDGPNMLPLSDMDSMIDEILAVREVLGY